MARKTKKILALTLAVMMFMTLAPMAMLNNGVAPLDEDYMVFDFRDVDIAGHATCNINGNAFFSGGISTLDADGLLINKQAAPYAYAGGIDPANTNIERDYDFIVFAIGMEDCSTRDPILRIQLASSADKASPGRGMFSNALLNTDLVDGANYYVAIPLGTIDARNVEMIAFHGNDGVTGSLRIRYIYYTDDATRESVVLPFAPLTGDGAIPWGNTGESTLYVEPGTETPVPQTPAPVEGWFNVYDVPTSNLENNAYEADGAFPRWWNPGDALHTRAVDPDAPNGARVITLTNTRAGENDTYQYGGQFIYVDSTGVNPVSAQFPQSQWIVMTVKGDIDGLGFRSTFFDGIAGNFSMTTIAQAFETTVDEDGQRFIVPTILWAQPLGNDWYRYAIDMVDQRLGANLHVDTRLPGTYGIKNIHLRDEEPEITDYLLGCPDVSTCTLADIRGGSCLDLSGANDITVLATNNAGASINLTRETITFPAGFTPGSFSLDGGTRWRAVAAGDRSQFRNAVNFGRLLGTRGGITLHVSPSANAKEPGDAATHIIFPQIQGRADPQRWVPNFLIHRDLLLNPASNGKWVIGSGNARVGPPETQTDVMANIDIAVAPYEGAATTWNEPRTKLARLGGDVAPVYGKLFPGGGVCVSPLAGTADRPIVTRAAFWWKVGATASGSTFTPGSRPRRVNVNGIGRPPLRRDPVKDFRLRVGQTLNGAAPVTVATPTTLASLPAGANWIRTSVVRPNRAGTAPYSWTAAAAPAPTPTVAPTP